VTITVKNRPGGRTARTKAAVFAAVAALVAERGSAAVSIADVAERAGVAATSLYRRWGDIRALIMDVAVEQLLRERPLPDTGSLAGDLRKWARSIASSLRSPEGSSFFAALVATAMPPGQGASARTSAMQRRVDQVSMMLERARARGESPPRLADVMDYLLAPLYMRALFGAPASDGFAERLVERLFEEGRGG
jgi:AcrR family transcriptional regulator